MVIEDQYFTDEQDNSSSDKFPGFEAYESYYGSWRNVTLFKTTKLHQRSLGVRGVRGGYEEYDWVPIHHLRICSKPYPSCHEIHCDSDVTVMTRHPDSRGLRGGFPGGRIARFDARVMKVERKQHSSHSMCECVFWISLYEIPENLPLDWKERKLLPEHDKAVRISDIFSLREAAPAMDFDDIVAASLAGPKMVNSPGIQWITDGKCWYSTLKTVKPVSEISRRVDEESYADFIEYQRAEMQKYVDEEKGKDKPGPSTIEELSDEESDGECHEHVRDFDPILGYVCGKCGLVLLGIADIWTTDNAKRIKPAKRRRRDNDDNNDDDDDDDDDDNDFDHDDNDDNDDDHDDNHDNDDDHGDNDDNDDDDGDDDNDDDDGDDDNDDDLHSIPDNYLDHDNSSSGQESD